MTAPPPSAAPGKGAAKETAARKRQRRQAPAVRRPRGTPAATKTSAPADAAKPKVEAAAFYQEPSGSGYYLKIVALRDKGQAEALAKRLTGKGYNTYVVSASGGLYSVRVGKYKTRKEADSIAAPTRERRAAEAIDFALALLSGVLLALSFPRFGHPALAWIALAPLLLGLFGGWRSRAASAAGPLRALALGLVTGLVYFVGTVYWTASVMRQFGDLALPISILLMGLLAAYLALYPAIFALAVYRLRASFGRRALWLAPAVWVTTELGRGHLFTGFPWVLLGYSQASVLPVAQLASVFGVYGMSFLVALVNCTVVLGVLPPEPLERPVVRSVLVGRWNVTGWLPLGLALLTVAVVSGWGAMRLRASTLTREGAPIQRGPHPGQHRAGAEVGSVESRPDPRPLPGHEPDCRAQGREVHPLAGIVAAVLLRRRPAARGCGPAPCV